MKGQIANYIFGASTKVLVVSGFGQAPKPESFLLITNSTRGVIYHSPFDPTKVATFGNITYDGTSYSIQLTLNAAVSTSGHANSDKLHIVYDFPQPDNSSYGVVTLGGRSQSGGAAVVPLAAGTNALTVRDDDANTKLGSIDTDIGTTNDNAASTDTGNFSVISLFKRLLSRITSLVPANLTVTSTRLLVDGSGVTQPVSGSVTANAGTGIFAVSDRGATGEASVSSFSSTTSATLEPSNSNRKLLTIFNEGAGNLHVLYGAGTASTTNYSVRLAAGDYLEIEKYTGQVTAIFASSGTARVTEVT